jgi:DNA-directed RNA polymerase alpha subunit
MTNYDKVMLVVETDGSLTPREAMAEAIAILRAQAAGLALSDGGVSEGGVSALAEQEAASVAHESPAPAEPAAGVADESGGDAPAKKRGRKKKAE